MPRPSEQPLSDDAPLYIRWSPDRSPFAIELRLDLVSRIEKEITQAAGAGIEIGGVLVGSFPAAQTATVRIDDIEIISRGPEESGAYMLDPGQYEGFAQVRWKARGRGKTALGFFRSHLRSGQLRPSLADRSLLASEFKQAIYAALLIEARPPHTAALFLATNGKLPEEPSVREFRFKESEFKALPEVEAGSVDESPKAEQTPRFNARLYGTIAMLLLIGLAACIAMFSFTRRAPRPQWMQSSSQLQLAVAGTDHEVRITWNHAARELDGVTGATLTINDGSNHRQIQLGVDELRLGAVEYEPSTAHVQVTMALQKAGGSGLSQSADWGE